MTTSSIASDIDLDKKQVFQITWKPYYRFYLSKLVPARACRESLFLIKASFLNRLHGAESPFKTSSRGHLILSHFFLLNAHVTAVARPQSQLGEPRAQKELCQTQSYLKAANKHGEEAI